jgi:tyrosine-protein kinase
MIINKSDRDVGATTAISGHPRFSLAASGSWSRMLIAHWTWIALITIAATAVAAIVAELEPPIYKAQAEVAVYPASSAAGPGLQAFVMGTEKGIASSGTVLSVVSRSLFIPESKLRQGLSVTVPVDTDLLVISFSDPSPQVAQSVAEAVAEEYVLYRASTARSNVTGTVSPTPFPPGAVQPAIVTDATLPTSRVSPNRKLIVGVGLVLGLALGIGLALLRDMLDDGLRGALDLQTQAETPVLAQIPAFRRKRQSLADALIIVRNPNSAVAEAYRNLRTRVLQIAAWRRGNMLLVTSPGREDKSTVAANLATALALTGKNVVLVCADLRWGRTHALFGLDNQLGLANVVNGEATLADALRRTEVPRLLVLPGGQAYVDQSSVLQSTAFLNLLGQLRSQADLLVIDAPPLLASADTAALAELGALILLVADARVSTRAEVRAATKELAHVRDDLIGCVLDNAGGVRRLPAAPIGAAMRPIDQRANSESGLPVVPAANGHLEPERELGATTIHGEV